MIKLDMYKPEWAIRYLKDRGFIPDTCMDKLQKLWWGWYTQDNDFYNQPYEVGTGATPCKRLSMRPAAMLANEIPSLVMTDGTEISSEDEALNAWIEETMPAFADAQADFISNVFALGTGAWACDFETEGAHFKSTIHSYNAWQTIPLKGQGCAFLERVVIEGKQYDQLQMRYISDETKTEVIETVFFTINNHSTPVVIDDAISYLDTGQELPTWTLVKPSKYNQHDQHTVLGTSIMEDCVDAFRLVDESLNQMYWQVRLSLPRMIADESALRRDPKTGKPMAYETMNQILYAGVESSTGDRPITIYNPDTHIADMVSAMNHALGLLGQRAGFGVGYWSFDLNSGLKTATEVVASNSSLMRTIRRHEHELENALRRLIQGAYSAHVSLNGGHLTELPQVSVLWDDSVVSDDKQDRDMMKDDISRGLCPKWRYLTTYYAMSEEEARAFTGEGTGAAPVAEVGE